MSEENQPQEAHSASTELYLLAVMLQSPRALAEIQLMVNKEDFYRPVHQLLFEYMIELADQDKDLDPILLTNTLVKRGKAQHAGAVGIITEMMGMPVIAANVGEHAMRVRELARVRRFRQLLTRGLQVVAETERGWWNPVGGQQEVDLERLQMRMAEVMLDAELLVDEELESQDIKGLAAMSEFISIPDSPNDWLVHGLMERQDVWMVLGSEGGGKSYLSRQFVMTMGAGIHPFRWDERIDPVRSLLIDLENADSMIRRQSREYFDRAGRVGDQRQLNDNTWIWREQAGLNLRKHEDQMRFRSVVERVRPEFIALGSLYNAMVRGNDDWETAAEDVKVFLNRMRARYGFALVLEHHMPKGDGRDRPRTPYGSSVWQRWVTHGRVIAKVADNLWEFSQDFRNDRDARPGIPVGLERGGQFAWSPIWTQADLDARVEIADEVEVMRGRANGVRV